MSLSEKIKEKITPIEQLQALNKESKTALENSLLKEALAISSEQCEELIKKSNHLQVLVEQKRQSDNKENKKLLEELKVSVLEYKKSNELLSKKIEDTLGALRGDLLLVTQNEVKNALSGNIKAMQEQTKALEKNTDNQSKTMKTHLAEYKQKQEKFFELDGYRNLLFWVSQIAWIIFLLGFIINKWVWHFV